MLHKIKEIKQFLLYNRHSKTDTKQNSCLVSTPVYILKALGRSVFIGKEQ